MVIYVKPLNAVNEFKALLLNELLRGFVQVPQRDETQMSLSWKVGECVDHP